MSNKAENNVRFYIQIKKLKKKIKELEEEKQELEMLLQMSMIALKKFEREEADNWNSIGFT